MNRATFVVEDIQVIRDELMPSMVELANARLLGFADNEADAVAWFHDHANVWDDAVIDLFYPHGKGFGVLAALIGRSFDQRAIVLTNYCTDAMRARCSALGGMPSSTSRLNWMNFSPTFGEPFVKKFGGAPTCFAVSSAPLMPCGLKVPRLPERFVRQF
jgi:two-component system OmpR family response regulator